jgi:hypothetical protein
MTKPKDMPTRAREFARIAARHSIMKGIPASDAGVCFIAEGFSLIYGISPLRASELAQHLIPHVREFLQGRLLEDFATSQGVTTEEAATMIMEHQPPAAG